MSLLSIRQLGIEFTGAHGPQRVLHGVDLEVGAGEVVAVVGESGSGKSLTAAAVMGLLPARGCRAWGQVRFDGRELLGLREAEHNAVRGQGIGIVFQNSLSSLDPSFRIGEQMAEGLRYRLGLGRAQAAATAGSWLERVGIREPGRVLRAYPHELSGGMRQRILIAMAVMARPRLLIADEPTTALDPTVQKQILDLLRDLHREDGTAILLITHDFGVVSYLSERVAVLRAGRVVEHGRTADVLRAPDHPYTAALLAAVPQGRAPEPASVSVPAYEAGAPGQGDGAVLALRGIGRRFGSAGGGGVGGWLRRGADEVVALQPTDLALRRGEILGLIGESGSGKSTLARLAARLLEPSGGSVLAGGQDVTALHGRALAGFRRDVQFVFQDSGASLNPRRTIGAQIADPLLRLGVARNAAPAQALAAQALEHVGLQAQHLARYPHEFSGGQRQRIGIARALAPRPACVILDEPTSALDVSIQAQVLALLRRLRDELDLTYLFISHDLGVVASFCDRIAVMERGRIVDRFASAALHDPARHAATRRLLDAVLPLPLPHQVPHQVPLHAPVMQDATAPARQAA